MKMELLLQLINWFFWNQLCKFSSSIEKLPAICGKTHITPSVHTISNFQFMLTDIHYCSLSKYICTQLVPLYLIQNCQFFYVYCKTCNWLCE
jgi:hypothetical protein